jgi:hypothetical protein
MKNRFLPSTYFTRPHTTKTHIKMPDQPEVVAAEVPVEDQVDAPLKEAAKEAVEAPADNGECAAEEAPAE